MIKVITNKPLAFDSPDFIKLWGAKNDNTKDPEFYDEIEQRYNGEKINYLDLGCSGGGLVADMHHRGHFAVGLEGTDYSAKTGRAEWAELYNKNLFTADVTEPYAITVDDKPVLFDIISAFELVEHIHPTQLNRFFKHISNNLKHGGMFIASVSTKEDIIDGVVLHQSVFSEIDWRYNILTEEQALNGTNLELVAYPFNAKPRRDGGSFHIGLKRI
jgi:SAM-dependent methyltransferase